VKVKHLAKYTLFNLGRCCEGSGYLPEATATYTQLVAIADAELDELRHLDVRDFRPNARWARG
jgi:hypothetical protein